MPSHAPLRLPFSSLLVTAAVATTVLMRVCWWATPVLAESFEATQFPEPIAQQGTIAFEVRTTRG